MLLGDDKAGVEQLDRGRVGLQGIPQQLVSLFVGAILQEQLGFVLIERQGQNRVETAQFVKIIAGGGGALTLAQQAHRPSDARQQVGAALDLLVVLQGEVGVAALFRQPAELVVGVAGMTRAVQQGFEQFLGGFAVAEFEVYQRQGILQVQIVRKLAGEDGDLVPCQF